MDRGFSDTPHDGAPRPSIRRELEDLDDVFVETANAIADAVPWLTSLSVTGQPEARFQSAELWRWTRAQRDVIEMRAAALLERGPDADEVVRQVVSVIRDVVHVQDVAVLLRDAIAAVDRARRTPLPQRRRIQLIALAEGASGILRSGVARGRPGAPGEAEARPRPGLGGSRERLRDALLRDDGLPIVSEGPVGTLAQSLLRIADRGRALADDDGVTVSRGPST